MARVVAVLFTVVHEATHNSTKIPKNSFFIIVGLFVAQYYLDVAQVEPYWPEQQLNVTFSLEILEKLNCETFLNNFHLAA